MKRYIVIALIACVCFFNGCGSDNTFLDVTKSSADTGNFYLSWPKVLGGSGQDVATSIQQTGDGGIL